MSGGRVSASRASYLVEAYAMGIPGAAPVWFKAVDLRERPNHPEARFELAIQPETITAVLGDEDSGIGDLGKFILGLTAPPSGQVQVFGTVIADLDFQRQLLFRRRLGYLMTGDGLLQNLTLRGNISLPLSFASDHRVKEVTARVVELVEQLQLGDVADLRPAAVNEEIRRRAALARAIALDPELLVLESPFDGLTARAAHNLLEWVRHRRDGTPRTIFLTAQDIGQQVLLMMNRVVHIEGGLAVEGLE
jgi:ABC-type transporter Mla maintaining outer membrane lipid asymmetry ATPase subunit MlaF